MKPRANYPPNLARPAILAAITVSALGLPTGVFTTCNGVAGNAHSNGGGFVANTAYAHATV